MKRLIKCNPKKAVAEGNLLKITFPFNYDTLSQVKSLSGRKPHLDRTPKYWTCPINRDNLLSLKENGFVLQNLSSDDVKKVIKITTLETIKPIKVKGLKKKLRDFQKIGVFFIHVKSGRALIADEMGLGKTIQSLAYIQLRHTKRPVVIVCPKSAKLMWKREARKWLNPNPKIRLLQGQKSSVSDLKNSEIIIINYDILKYWVDELKRLKPQIIITDECHYYKSDSAQRTIAVKKLAKDSRAFIALSGTPIETRPSEIFNAVHIINPGEFPDKWQFLQRYCDAKRTGFGWDFSGSSNELELHEKLVNSVMIRRLKKDVLKELPEKVWSYVPLELDNANEYQEAEENFISYLRRTKGEEAAERASYAEQLVQIGELKQLAAKGKMTSVVDWIKDFLYSGEKLVVFAINIFVIDRLMNEFGDIAVRFDGSVNDKNRDINVTKFQTDSKVKLFVGQMKAAGVVITLTAASNVAIIQYPDTPGIMLQAPDRCHRIGQKKSVTVYCMLVEGTVEERQAKLLDRRVQMISSIMDGGISKNEEQSLLTELINSYHEKKKTKSSL